MKHNAKKLISLILVLVMLVTMIPVGIFTANAEGADYTVSSVEEWNALAAQNLTFEGQTVALGGNIDAQGAELKTLASEFKGTLEGNGYTISNATVAGSALLAPIISGTATVQNLKLANVDLTSTGEAGLLATAVADGTITVTKVNADAESSVTGAGVVGGFFAGVAFTAETSSLTISYVKMEAAVTTGNFNAGGLIGNDTSTKGNITVDTTVVKSILTHAGDTYSAGIIGRITGVNKQDAQVLTMTNVAVGGTQSGSTGHSSIAHDCVFFTAANGTINYDKLYVLPGASSFTMSLAYYAAWMNGLQWGSGVREKLSVAAITQDGRTDPPTEITAAEEKALIKLDENGFVTKIIDPNCVHDWSEYVLVSTATKNDVGIEKRICSKCQMEDIKETPAHGWTVEEFLADYENKTTCNITSAEEWHTLALAGKSFEGKTVKLCADISGINRTLANTFAGKFLGGNFTISDSAISGSGLIANTITGDVRIENLKLKNVDVSNEGNAGLLAGKVVTEGRVTVTRVNADADCSVYGSGTIGGLFGETEMIDSLASLTISYVLLEATVETTSGMAGGLIGQDFSKGGQVTLENSAMLCAVKSPGSKNYANGLIGTVGAVAGDSVKITLSKVLLGGTQRQFAGFWMQEDAEVFYDSFFINDGTNTNLFGANRYATWINGARTTDLGVGGRGSITIASITEKGTITAPKLLGAEESALNLGEDGYVLKIGRPLDTPTLSLANYDTETTFTIKNLADWELIAASGKDFAGKKILLDTDIDAWSESVSTLTNEFKGSFDGQGHLFSNAVMTGNAVLANTIIAGEDLTIENLKISGVTVKCRKGASGVLVGTLKGTDANVTIRKINIERSSAASADYSGGLIGLLNVSASTKPITVDLSQLSIAASVRANGSGMQAGGLIGHDSSNGTSATNTVTMNILDSKIICTVAAVSNSCGLIGHYTGGNEKNGNGVLADAENRAYLNLNNLIIGGGANYKILYTDKGVINYKDLYLVDTNGRLFGANTFGTWINGVVTKSLGTSSTNADGVTSQDRGNITVESMAAQKVQPPRSISVKGAEKILLKDANGFISLVPGYLQAVALQQSVEVGDTYAIRFVAPSQFTVAELETMNVQMKITATWYDALGVLHTRIFDTASGESVDEAGDKQSGCLFYDFLKAYGDHGLPEKTISCVSLGAKALAGFTIWDIPVDAVNMPSGITFEATVSYTNEFGNTVTSRPMTVSVDAQGAVIA